LRLIFVLLCSGGGRRNNKQRRNTSKKQEKTSTQTEFLVEAEKNLFLLLGISDSEKTS